jgi:hypothetical protein
MGAAHCDHYRENEALDSDMAHTRKLTKINQNDGNFAGVKKICMSDISLGGVKMAKPSQKNIDAILAYYNQYGKFDKPILVCSCGDGYVLKRRYARYYVAKQLGLEHIDARIGEEPSEIERICTVGSGVVHTQYGSGTVKKVSPTMVEVCFAKGIVKTFDIKTCIEQEILKPKLPK